MGRPQEKTGKKIQKSKESGDSDPRNINSATVVCLVLCSMYIIQFNP